MNDREEQDKDKFYKTLQSVNDIYSERDIKKDLNTKKVSDDNGYQEVLGQHGLGEMNETGRDSLKAGGRWLGVFPGKESQDDVDMATPCHSTQIQIR